ncbi:MAG: hypothetical protein QN229_03330 [Desulfurococcaceae archaeon TW002]
MRKLSLGQTDLITVMVLTSVALIIGISVLAYFQTISSTSTSEIERENILNSELAAQVVKLISVDETNKVLWLLFRRLDNASVNFLVMVEAKLVGGNTELLECSRISYYVPEQDKDKIVCSEPNECRQASVIASLPYRNFLVKPEGSSGWVDINVYKRSVGENPYSPDYRLGVCYVTYKGGNQIVRIDYSGLGDVVELRIYLLKQFGNDYYVLRIYKSLVRS